MTGSLAKAESDTLPSTIPKTKAYFEKKNVAAKSMYII